MKNWLNYFIYVSIIFLVVALVRADYLVKPKIYSYSSLCYCILLLCIGFIFDALMWWKTLRSSGYTEVRVGSAIASNGMAIFGKYIPGKLWLIWGRSAYVAKKYHYEERDLAFISLTAQLISLWTGFLLSAFIFIYIPAGGFSFLGVAAFLCWVMLSLILFTTRVHDIFSLVSKKIFRKELDIPRIGARVLMRIVPWSFVSWAAWCLSFYFLIGATTNQDVSVLCGLSFAFAGTVGLVVVISPGGIGVREGILTGILTLSGLPLQDATTVSVVSRLWFLCGEAFIFLTAVVVSLLGSRGLMKFGRRV